MQNTVNLVSAVNGDMDISEGSDSCYGEFRTVKDVIKSTEDTIVYRAALRTPEDVAEWLKGYEVATNTKWIVNNTKPNHESAMEVLNKFRSTVTSTVSQLSGVLPGNPVTREYEVSSHIASAGPGLLWKIYQGYKKSTKQEAAIFVFEKRQLDRWPRGDRDVILETLKRGVSQITRLRHPQILTVQHPLEESRESLAFATEPVFASLANIMGKTENMPSPLPSSLKNYSLFEIEIKYGLLQVGEGLAFLHNDVKLLHRNLCLESIVVNHQGAWKIFGFDFCVLNQEMQDGKPFWPFTEYNPSMNPLAQPTLDFLAPECALTSTHSPASDMYSLGMVIFALHNSGQPVYSCGGDWNSYKRHVKEMKQPPASKLLCVPEGLRDIVKLMLNGTPEVRADAHQFIKVNYFEDACVKTLNYLDSLFQWDNLQKSQLYKGLPEIMRKLPHRVCLNRVLPCLAKEFVNHTMVPFVLPNVLLMAENATKEEYIEKILPELKAVMKIQEPVQVLLIFMQRMELLLKLTPAEQVRSDVLPMVFRALESDAQQIQELCLTVLPTFAGLVDYPAMKNALLPRIKRLCINTSYLSVRVNCLVCLGKLLEHLDKWLVLDEVLPFLPQIPSREPAVIMGILGIFKLALTHKKLGITKEVMATKILPFLMPLCIENGLTIAQFNALTTLVKDMFQRVETEHRAKLEQLNSMQQQTNTMNTEFVSSQSLIPAPSPKTEIDDMFSGLGISSLSSPTDKPISNNSNSTVTSPTSGYSLSIQEKQRLANEQENKRRLQTQSQIIPTKVSPAVKPETKDLTITLMESNLKQISHVTPSLPAQAFSVQPVAFPAPPFRPAGAAPGMVTSPTGFTAFQSTPALAWPNNSTAPQWNAGNLNSNAGIVNSNAGIMNSNAGNMNSNAGNMNAQAGWTSMMTSPSATPLSNVLRSPSSQFSSPVTQQNQAKSLSTADINDLLG